MLCGTDPNTMRILRREAVTEKTGLERSAIYQRMALGTFPKQVKLSAKAVGWLESEVDAWIASKVAARDSGETSERTAAEARRLAKTKATKAAKRVAA